MGYIWTNVSMLRTLYTSNLARFFVLMLLWLAAYKLAALLEIFRPYSSLWFLPAGVTLSIFLAAPGWLKLAPFAANLLLAWPQFSQFIIDDNGGPITQVLHAIRHCGIYGLTAWCLIRIASRPPRPARLKTTLVFVTLVALAAMLAALAGISLHVWAGNMSWATGWSIMVQWTIGDAVAALVLPPILVPTLKVLLLGTAPAGPIADKWPLHLLLVSLALAIGSQAGQINPELGSLWYLTLLPPIFAGVIGGFAGAAISVFFTCLATPIAAYTLSYNGEMVALSLLLTIGAIAALLVGAAVSDQRRAMAEVIGQREKLEQAVAERTSELADAYEFQRHLVRSLGHDLRQPLHTLALLIEGLLLHGKFDPEPLGQARSISATMGGFLDGILNYARHDPGVISPNLQVLSVAKLFEQLASIYGPIAQSRNVHLTVQPSTALLVSDELLLLQGLSNDLDNAIRLSQPDMVVELRHENRVEQDALIVTDQIVEHGTNAPGAAGFGRNIVARVCKVLEATRIEKPGQHGMLLKASLPASTQNARSTTSNS